MRSRVVVLAATGLFASGCFDFDGLIDKCRDGGCLVDAGAGGGGGAGGGSSGGGGSAVGGGIGGGTGGGGGSGGGGGQGAVCALSGNGTPLIVNGGASCSESDGTAFCFNGFYWENPLPQGNDLTAVWGTGPSDVWAGGDGAMLMHYDGLKWTSYQLQPSSIDDDASQVSTLFGQLGALYVPLLGDPALVISNFHSYPAGITNAIQFGGSPADGVWAVTRDASAKIRHFDCDGGSNVVVSTATDPGTRLVSDLSGGAFVALEAGAAYPIFHCDARTCGPPFAVLTVAPSSMSALAPGEALISTLPGPLLEADADGGVFDAGLAPFPFVTWTSLAGSAGLMVGDGVGLSLRDGGGWDPPIDTATIQGNLDHRATLLSSWAAPGLQGSWAVGTVGVMLQYSDGVFNVRSGGYPQANAFAMVVAAANGVFAGGNDGTRYRRDPSSGTWFEISGNADFYSESGCVLPDGGALIGGQTANRPSVTEDFTDALLPASVQVGTAINVSVSGLACLPSGPLAVAGDSIYRRTDGGWVLDQQEPGETFFSAAGYDDAHVAAIGLNTLYVYADGGWVSHSPPAAVTGLNSVWISPGGRVYVGGRAGNYTEWVGTLDEVDYGNSARQLTASLLMPRSASLLVETSIYALGGTSDFDVWAAGTDGRLMHKTDAGFVSVETGVRGHRDNGYAKDFEALTVAKRADGGPELFLVGDQGIILRHPY